MPVDLNGVRPIPGAAAPTLGPSSPTVKTPLKKSPTMRLGSLTQRFFLKGEEQEASGYENVVLEAEPHSSPELEFESFDKIPRRRRPLLAVTGLVSLVALGVVAWKKAPEFLHQTSRASIATATQSALTIQPMEVAPAKPVPAPPIQVAAVAPPPPTEMKTVPAVESAPPTPEAAPIARTMPTESSIPRAVVTHEPAVDATRPAHVARRAPVERTEAVEDDGTNSATTVRKSGRSPLRGYVWSPAAQALVPAESAGTARDSDPARTTPEPEPPPAPTQPTPTEPTRTAREVAPILD